MTTHDMIDITNPSFCKHVLKVEEISSKKKREIRLSHSLFKICRTILTVLWKANRRSKSTTKYDFGICP
jgi:hypothetical protein